MSLLTQSANRERDASESHSKRLFLVAISVQAGVLVHAMYEHFDFIEVGTSDFRTLTQYVKESDISCPFGNRPLCNMNV